ncbi:CBS domain-containing protein [Virgibacillus halophilus]|uniref:CBS domain-containing protein n=1 Tax=Tigheibacillus halophilus TaxID=361280 RepID=A0ABU5C6Q9_9BACI|nr:CBS domain-containing protein [Virgibacillus halophilus]
MTDLHTVGSWMNKATESVTISMPIKYALQVLHRSGKTELPVTEKGHYIGTLRERDCIKLLMDGRSPNEAIAGAVDTAHQAVHRDFSMEAIRELPVYVVTENTNELLGGDPYGAAACLSAFCKGGVTSDERESEMV